MLEYSVCLRAFHTWYLFYLLKEKTGSEKGAAVLREWEAYLPLFWQLVPPSEEDSPEACAEFEKVAAAGRMTLQSAA